MRPIIYWCYYESHITDLLRIATLSVLFVVEAWR
jgi:hypothetical protein